MTYASVAAHNAPPPSEQPHADPSLLTTPSDVQPAATAVDDSAKVNVAPADFKSHPATLTSEVADSIPPYPISESPAPSGKPSARKRAQDAEKKAEAKSLQLWGTIHEQLMRPAVAGGLIGVVNVGLMAGTAYAYYSQPHLRRDTKIISSTVIGGLVLLGGEGYLAEAYRNTAQGQKEERRAREEGSVIYRHLREQVLRPGVLGGLVGLANVGIIGTVGYFAYTNWDRPHWDRRTLSAISVGLLTLWGGEGYIAEQVREGKIQPPRP